MNSSNEFSSTLSVRPKTKMRKREQISKKACNRCRNKKIKCTRETEYLPCSQCKTHNSACIVDELPRKRGSCKGYVRKLEDRIKKMEKALLDIAEKQNLPKDLVKEMKNNQESISGSSESDTDEPKKDDCCMIGRMEKPYSYVGGSSGIYLLNRLVTRNLQDTEHGRFPKPVDQHGEDLMVAGHGSSRIKVFEIDAILNPDWKFPPKEVMDHIIRIYFKVANCMLPILSEEDFYKEYNASSQYKSFVPIMLSICRLACCFLDKDDPIIKKYSIKVDELYEDLTDQIQKFSNVNFFEPKIETIQFILINAMNTNNFGISSKDWIKVSIAVKMAQDLGLHRANTQNKSTSNEIELKKRIWWSVYIVDRWFCCIADRPLAIVDYDCDQTIPLIKGFDGNEDYSIFLHFIKLANIFGEVYRRIYTRRAKKLGYKTKSMEITLGSLDQALKNWFKEIPNEYKVKKEQANNLSINADYYGIEDKKPLIGGLLTLCYYGLLILLYRSFIDLGEINIEDMPYLASANCKCKEAAISIVNMARTIPGRNSFVSGWIFSSHSMFDAALVHIYNLKSSNGTIRKEASEYIDIIINEYFGAQNMEHHPYRRLIVALKSCVNP